MVKPSGSKTRRAASPSDEGTAMPRSKLVLGKTISRAPIDNLLIRKGTLAAERTVAKETQVSRALMIEGWFRSRGCSTIGDRSGVVSALSGSPAVP